MSRNLCFQSSFLIDTVPPAFLQQKSIIFFDMPYCKLLSFHIITLLGRKKHKGQTYTLHSFNFFITITALNTLLTMLGCFFELQKSKG